MKPKLLFLSFVVWCAACGQNSNDCTPQASGTTWTPQLVSSGVQTHDPSVVVTDTVQSFTGPITGLQQPITAAQEIPVTIDMTQDLGAGGSLTLEARTDTFPGNLEGGAWPVLVSLNDGANELINLSLTGSHGDCAESGLYQCHGDVCNPNPSCTINYPSAYVNREDWEQHNSAVSPIATNAPTIYRFPTCNWTDGNPGNILYPACAFNTTFFVNQPTPRLRFGVKYTAKYILLSDTYPSVSGATGAFQLHEFRKFDNRSQRGGVFDINLVLVGSNNVKASRTAKGRQNLNTLVSMVQDFYHQSQPNINLGTVTPVEWTCQAGGESFADLPTSQAGVMFAAAQTILPPGEQSKAVNVFLSSTIRDDTNTLNPSLTVLGLDGAIVGPLTYGTAESGLAVATFDELDQFNPRCDPSLAVCPVSQQESSFYELAETIAHEVGHYLGLNHPSEASGSLFDAVYDTPVCTQTQSINGMKVITGASCRVRDSNSYPLTSSSCAQACPQYDPRRGIFCPKVPECQFNYLMWWTTKNFNESNGTADGDMVSPEENTIIDYSPLVY